MSLKTGMLLLVFLVSTTVAVEGVTETLPKIRSDSKIDESLWAMSKDENLSYKSAHDMGHQLAQQIISSDKDCFHKVAQRYLPQALFQSDFLIQRYLPPALFESNHSSQRYSPHELLEFKRLKDDEISIFEETGVLTQGLTQDHKFYLQQGFVSSMIDAFVHSTGMQGKTLQPRFLEIIKQSKLPGGILDNRSHGPLPTELDPSKDIIAYLKDPPSNERSNADDVTQYFFIFQLWCIAERLTRPTSNSALKMVDEHQKFQKLIPSLASLLVVLHDSQMYLKIAPMIAERSEAANSLSQETAKFLSHHGFLPEAFLEDEEIIQHMLKATSLADIHYRILKKNKDFEYWALSRPVLIEIYKRAMEKGKELSKESRLLIGYQGSIKAINKKLIRHSLESSNPEA
ncbi:hypothetical protein PGTUg99_032167 [Puccinia graminis f. sp. tritici]|uniref:Uncharacterized protein n=1 Tax=Puccinia graminis f. sp. tritici TaxID=56615 RepID=A0A5B0RG61_PUCGR|nr:hypothetical protein PGTUg99_032167 [Puccinia graminis f. sp. tritici]